MNKAATLQTILLVDDEADILTVAEIALNQVGGFEVQAFDSSQKAVDAVEEIMPDLIMLDMMMPNMDGLQTLDKIRTISSLDDVPVIFMTAKVQNNEINMYLKAGAIGVIEKPFDPMLLAEQVTQLWQENMSGLSDE